MLSTIQSDGNRDLQVVLTADFAWHPPVGVIFGGA